MYIIHWGVFSFLDSCGWDCCGCTCSPCSSLPFQATLLDSMGFCVGPAVFDSAHVNVPCPCADAPMRRPPQYRNVQDNQSLKTGLQVNIVNHSHKGRKWVVLPLWLAMTTPLCNMVSLISGPRYRPPNWKFIFSIMMFNCQNLLYRYMMIYLKLQMVV